MRDKNKLKVDVLNVLVVNKGRVLDIEDLKTSLFIEKTEQQAFEQALKELEKEGKVQKYVGLP